MRINSSSPNWITARQSDGPAAWISPEIERYAPSAAWNDAIVGLFVTVFREETDAAEQDHRSRCDHASSQQHADDRFQPPIIHSSHSLPFTPVTIISTAMTPTTPAKIQRKTRTRAPMRCRAPISDPASTPSITGIASPGSIYPRLR